MSFDEYVNHISQKYRIAIAISVIKTKPTDLSIDEYLAHLQRKIKDMEFDPNETVCSDDFNFDDDEFMDQNQREIPKAINNGNEFDYKSNNTVINEDLQDYSQNSQTILNDFMFEGDVASIDVNVHVPNLENSANALREATGDAQADNQKFENHQNVSQLTYCESQELGINNDNTNIPRINYNANNNHINAMTNLDSQETELYSLEAFTQNYTHVSQTQEEQFIVSHKFIRGIVNNDHSAEKTRAVDNEIDKNKITMVTKDRERGDMPLEYDSRRTVAPNELNIHNKLKSAKENDKEQGHNYNMDKHYNMDDYNQIGIPNSYELARGETENNNFATNRATEECINVIDYTVIANDVHEATNNGNYDIIARRKEKGINNNFEDNEQLADGTEENDNFEDNIGMDIDGTTESDDNSQVKVPFKVLEELHRVKAFLNKKDRRHTDGYSTDSGYRSDSQIRGSLKNSSQSSVVWINQSAHCLFTYVITASAGCGDIINEISQALGQLIDKLHDEENYPPFLEELLETVDSLIRELHEGDNWAEDALISKDETTHRLVLLNKSIHILKHSLGNITNILEQLHTNLTQDTQYELTQITQIENTSYIFHILEIFLKKYLKAKSNSSQVTQNSQEEDRFLKRSSLTELWKKKWNPNYKEMTLLEENASVCILKKCSDVLNKLIVECMDGYSLVSFAALQCFNIIQL